MHPARTAVLSLHVVCPGAAGLDVHKLRVTAAVRICEAGRGPARIAVREFGAQPDGLQAMTAWLRDHAVVAAALESTGVYSKALVAGQPPPRILANLTRHVQVKLEPLARVLAATLDSVSLIALQMQLAAVDGADAALAALDAHIERELADFERPLRLLQTIPGIDRESASAILAETGPDPGTFRGASRLAAWAGVAPGNHSSAGKRRSRRARRGNRALRRTLAACAHGAARSTSSQFHCFHRTLADRLGYKRAILATAHKLLRVIHAVLRDDRPYTNPGIDYACLVIERGTPRWLRVLEQYGFLEEVRALRD